MVVRDVITIVLLSAVLIVIQLVVNMVCMANDFVSMVLSVGITMFLCAPVYMLMVSRIGKRFVTLIYMTLLGVIFLLMGNWFLLPYFLVGHPLRGDSLEGRLLPKAETAHRRLDGGEPAVQRGQSAAHLVLLGYLLRFCVGKRMEQSYIDSYVRYYTSPGWLAFILLFTTLMGFLGCMVGSRLIRRHFKKAGVL